MNRGLTAIATLVAAAALFLAPMGVAHAEDPAPVASSAPADATPSPSPTDATPTPEPTGTPTATPTAAPTAPPTATPTPTPTPTPKPVPKKQPRRKLPLRNGDFGPLIRDAQSRLTWLGYTITPKTLDSTLFGDSTESAVKKFQIKFWIKPTGVIDTNTWNHLKDLAGKVGQLPKQCTDTTTICADKTQKILRYVVKGKVVMTTDARFGLPSTPTGEGAFRVGRRDYDHTSTLFHTWMPRALFFNGGEAVHYSPYFAHDGYNGGSHGCIGIRDMAIATWLFSKAPTGTRVYVYRS